MKFDSIFNQLECLVGSVYYYFGFATKLFAIHIGYRGVTFRSTSLVRKDTAAIFVVTIPACSCPTSSHIRLVDAVT